MVEMKATGYRLLMLEVLICFGLMILNLFFGLIMLPFLLPYYLAEIGDILTGTSNESLLYFLLPISSIVCGLVGLVSLIYVVRSLRRNYLNPRLLPRIRIGFILGMWALIQLTVLPLLLALDENLVQFSLIGFFLGNLFSLWLPLLCGIHVMYLGEKLAKTVNAEH